MSEGNSGGGGNALMGVVVGALLVAAAAFGFMALNGGMGRQSADISIEAPQAPSGG